MCTFFGSKQYVPFWKHIQIPSMFLMRYIPELFPFVLLFFLLVIGNPLSWFHIHLLFAFRSIFWTCFEINGMHPTIFQELNDNYLCHSTERNNMGVGIQVHPLEKEHTSGWWVLLYNQQAYSVIQGLKNKCFL